MSLLSLPVGADSSLGCKRSQAFSLSGHGCEGWLQSSRRIVVPYGKCLRKTEQEWAPVLSVGSARPTLDDVERLSRGRASKAKIGSRAVPHRLNMDERKAYELAKKRGFVVSQPNTRRYPLINSHRNYCDALGIPCIRIDQGLAGQADEVVMDLCTLRLSEVELQTFREIIIKGIESVLSQNSQALYPSVNEGIEQISDAEDSLYPDRIQSECESPNFLDVVSSESTEETSADSKPLRIQASSRSEAKRIAQTGVDIWKSWSRSNLKVVA